MKTEIEFILGVLTNENMAFYDDKTETFDYSNGFWNDGETNLLCCLIKDDV